MKQNIFLQEYLIYQLNIFLLLLEFILGNLMECEKESIEIVTKSESNFAQTFVDHHILPDINFNGHCLIKKNVSIPKKVINLYISYTLGSKLRNLNTDFTLSNCLFGSLKLTKNAELDKYLVYWLWHRI